MIDVDEEMYNEDAGDGKEKGKLPKTICIHVVREKPERYEAGEKFYERIPPGNPGPAKPALSSQEKETDHGNVVVPLQLTSAAHAGRPGDDQILFLWQTDNDDVKETSDQTTKDE